MSTKNRMRVILEKVFGHIMSSVFDSGAEESSFGETHLHSEKLLSIFLVDLFTVVERVPIIIF